VIGAVVLAAGESKRMGKQKLLLPIEGKLLIERAVDPLKAAAEEIVVVLGHQPEKLVPTLKKLGIRWVVNENYREGMASSFKRGLRELKGCDAVFLVLGDQPFVEKGFLLKAIRAWKAGAKIVSPVFKGKKGHPVLFDKSLFEEILSLQTHEMIREVICRHEGEHRLIEAGEWAVVDLDTPEAIRLAVDKWQRGIH
jgi:molybdenum cofactor cytidylyltransferase